MTRNSRLVATIGSGTPADRRGTCATSPEAGGGAGIARIVLVFLFGVHLALASALGAKAAEPTPQGKNDPAADRFMKLGTPGGEMGGAEKKAFELSQIKAQILTFIPPLLRPAFTQHAFVLPPNAFSVAVTQRFVNFDGDDFFKDGSVDPVFKDRTVERHFTDLDLFYGFDLNRKYLHGFTVRLNVPYIDTDIGGSLHPVGGNDLPRVDAIGSTQEIGDIGLFLKKKVLDQGNDPVGLAVVGGVFFPTGANDEKFGSGGRVNTATPGGNAFGLFKRFSDDGRLPSPAQPGTGTFSYLLGAFLTRQFSAGDFPGRSAVHIGAAHKFVFENEGVDQGDKTIYFVSFVKPVYKDFVAFDLSFVGVYKEDDEYDGKFIKPGTATLIDRPSFSGGFTHFIAPSLIFSPDPQIRLTVSGLFRFADPDLGPAPPWVLRAGLDVIF